MTKWSFVRPLRPGPHHGIHGMNPLLSETIGREVCRDALFLRDREHAQYRIVNLVAGDGTGPEVVHDTLDSLRVDISRDELRARFVELFSKIVTDMAATLESDGSAGDVVGVPPFLCRGLNGAKDTVRRDR